MVQAAERRPLFAVDQWCAFMPLPCCRFANMHLDKTIKLWKVFEKSLKVVAESNHYDGARPTNTPSSSNNLRLPRMVAQDQIVAAVPRKIYANAHAYHINSISVNSDGETYISADDLRINMWNLNISDQSFSKCNESIDAASTDR